MGENNTSGQEKVKKPFYKKVWFWVVVIVVVVLVGASSSMGNGDKNTKGTTTTTVETTTEKETTTVQPTTKSAKQVEKSYKKACKTIDFKTLSRNPNKHKGEKLKFTGQVIQVQESDSLFSDTKQVDLRINVTKETYEFIDDVTWTDTILATVNLEENADKILEDDIITIWGECQGDYTYESVLGSNVTLPYISIEYFEIN